MRLDELIDEVLQISSRFSWIRDVEVKRFKGRLRIRLHLNDSFVDVYYNLLKGVTSFAYIEDGCRLFGANNIRIGWHLHPFGRTEEHVPIRSISLKEFLEMLESELKKRGKLGC